MLNVVLRVVRTGSVDSTPRQLLRSIETATMVEALWIHTVSRLWMTTIRRLRRLLISNAVGLGLELPLDLVDVVQASVQAFTVRMERVVNTKSFG